MDFDESKFYLGILCKRNHKYKNTEQSLRYVVNATCVECNKLRLVKYNKERIKLFKKENEKVAIPDFNIQIFYLGSLCKYMHEYKNTGNSLRYIRGGNCICCTKNRCKRYYSKNRENEIQKQKEYYRKTVKHKKSYDEKYRQREYVKERSRLKGVQKRKNSTYRLNHNMSTGIYYSLKKNKRGCHWESLVEFAVRDLKKHLEQQFTGKTSWNNYGNYWTIDHIIPISWWQFDLPSDREFKQCWALCNLQPLETIKNISKNNKCLTEYHAAISGISCQIGG